MMDLSRLVEACRGLSYVWRQQERPFSVGIIQEKCRQCDEYSQIFRIRTTVRAAVPAVEVTPGIQIYDYDRTCYTTCTVHASRPLSFVVLLLVLQTHDEFTYR